MTNEELNPIGRFVLKNGTIVRLMQSPDGLMIAFEKSCLENGDIILLKDFPPGAYTLTEAGVEQTNY